MSLINEALKKAQKQRTDEPAAPVPAGNPVAATRVTKRTPPLPARTLVLIAGCCAALLVVCGTVFWLITREPPAPELIVRPAASPLKPVPAVTTPTAESAPALSDGAKEAALDASTAAIPTPEIAGNSAAAPAVTVVLPPAAGVVAADTAAPAPARVPAQSIDTPTRLSDPIRIALPDPQAQAVVDAFRVTGIRSSSSDPKVLMNDRVFRINDVVERTFNLRLIEVAADRLTFIDPAGATYVKDF